MNVTQIMVEDVKSDKDFVWSLANQILYDMCEQYPFHTTDKEIAAKLLIIGRTYAAAVERRKQNNDIQVDDFYIALINDIKKSDIDRHLKRFKDIKAIDIDTHIELILGTHSYLVNLIASHTGDNKRSFASKYLHFHAPHLFYIYDNFAEKALTKIQPRHRRSRTLDVTQFDRWYSTYFLRVLDLRDHIQQEFGETLTPRQLDRLLLNSSN